MVWFVALLVLLLDQWSKILIRANLKLGENLQIVPSFFNITYIHNSGAVWGILQNSSEYLAVFSILAIFFISFFVHKITAGKLQNKIAVGLILGGIAGNLVDRIKFGAVTDFLDFYIGRYHWPAFNVADAAICLGALGYAAYVLVAEMRSRA